jgi:uncharacterized protein
MTPALPGPLELLVLQPTPFCNINCSYCYLPDRQSTRRMRLDTLEQASRWVFSSGLVRGPFTVLWHAGEPLAVPLAFYERAFELLREHNQAGVPVRQSFQTNGTLIDQAWCDFFRAHDVDLGVSIDGPDFLHDKRRVTRRGEGTLERVLRGIRLLQRSRVPFGVLTVLTAESLDHPDELLDFYQEHRLASVAFNVEEIEGPHTTSSLLGERMQERFRRFFRRFMELALSADPPLVVREYAQSVQALRLPPQAPGVRELANEPWSIVNVDCEGNFSTFSPELLGLSSPRYGSFSLGNVNTHTLQDVLALESFRRIEADVEAGVRRCRDECDYYRFCGGGSPVNKYFENGAFASTETLCCRLHNQAAVDVTLDLLERRQGRPAPTKATGGDS